MQSSLQWGSGQRLEKEKNPDALIVQPLDIPSPNLRIRALISHPRSALRVGGFYKTNHHHSGYAGRFRNLLSHALPPRSSAPRLRLGARNLRSPRRGCSVLGGAERVADFAT